MAREDVTLGDLHNFLRAHTSHLGGMSFGQHHDEYRINLWCKECEAECVFKGAAPEGSIAAFMRAAIANSRPQTVN